MLEPAGVPLLINDRVDVALAAEADGVHIGQDDMSAADARLLLGRTRDHRAEHQDGRSRRRPRRSTCSTTSAIGGVYATTSKDNTATPIGIAGLRASSQAIRARSAGFPICAIAGINAGNAAEVIAAGADGVAVISALSLAADPAQRRARSARGRGRRARSGEGAS